MKKQIPILFSTSMVQAILAGKKTQTRRIVKSRHSGSKGDGKLHPVTYDAEKWVNSPSSNIWAGFNGNVMATAWTECPYGKPGDILWVRETWSSYRGFGEETKEGAPIIFRADEDECGQYPIKVEDEVIYVNQRNPWKPSIHMPKSVARIWLEVVSVKVERLQDISQVDAINEGVLFFELEWCFEHFPLYKQNYYEWKTNSGVGRPPIGPSPYARYRKLWQLINNNPKKPDTHWDSNLWVWGVEFKKVDHGKISV